MTTMIEEGVSRAAVNAGKRAELETLLARAEKLPPSTRALVFASLDRGMSNRELAALNGLTPRQLRSRLDRLRAALSDSAFLLAAKYVDSLPRNLRPLVRAYWFEGCTMRDLAAQRNQTLHRIRLQVDAARSLLLVAMSSESARAKAKARRSLCENVEPVEE